MSNYQIGILIWDQVYCGFERTTVNDSPVHDSHFREIHHDIMKAFAMRPVTTVSHRSRLQESAGVQRDIWWTHRLNVYMFKEFVL